MLLKVVKLFFFIKGGGTISHAGFGGSGLGNKRHKRGGSEVQNLPSDLAKPMSVGTVLLHNVTEILKKNVDGKSYRLIKNY